MKPGLGGGGGEAPTNISAKELFPTGQLDFTCMSTKFHETGHLPVLWLGQPCATEDDGELKMKKRPLIFRGTSMMRPDKMQIAT